MSYYRQQLEEYLSQLEVTGELGYDIGGGQGAVASRLKHDGVAEWVTLDLPKWDLELLWVANKLKAADVVFCLEVFEYLIDPITAMENIKDVLKIGGKAYITFAFVYPHHNELDRDSMRWTETGIRRLMKRMKFTIDNIHYRVDRTGILKQFYAADGMRAAKEYPNHSVTGFIVECTNDSA